MTPETKTCRICGEPKPASEFEQTFTAGIALLGSRCRACKNARRAATSLYASYEDTRRDKSLRRMRAAANRAADRAIASGELTPGPCSCADATCRGAIKPHHEDYSLPLDVIWFCKSHHMRRHGALRRMGRQHLAQLGIFAADKSVQPRRKWTPKAGRFVRGRP